MKTVQTVILIILVICISGIIGCVIWVRNLPPTLTVISQTPIEEKHVDALRYAFTEYDIGQVDFLTLHLTPVSYRVLDSYRDAIRISQLLGVQSLAVYDTVQILNALVMQLRALLLFICLIVDIIIGRSLWIYTKHTALIIKNGIKQLYTNEFIRHKWKTLVLRTFVLLGGIIIMITLWSLCIFEPVWSPQSMGSLLSNMWSVAFPPIAAGSMMERVSTAATILFATGIVMAVSGFTIQLIQFRSRK